MWWKIALNSLEELLIWPKAVLVLDVGYRNDRSRLTRNEKADDNHHEWPDESNTQWTTPLGSQVVHIIKSKAHVRRNCVTHGNVNAIKAHKQAP
jgi:hypothetical protein